MDAQSNVLYRWAMNSDPIVQVNFRMPASLKARLEAAAAASHRTVTAELVARLEESFVGPSADALLFTRDEAAMIRELLQNYMKLEQRDDKRPNPPHDSTSD